MRRNLPIWRLFLSASLLALTLAPNITSAQRASPVPPVQTEPMTVNVSVRDARGMPLEGTALVRLRSTIQSYDVRSPTRETSTAVFTRVTQGEYEINVECTGYKSTTEHLQVMGFGGEFNTFIYLQREGDASLARPPSGIAMSPKLQGEIERGLDAMRKHQYDSAKSHFLKAARLSPANSNAAYLLGTAELALKQNDLARAQFESALRLEPAHERALLALGELQLQSGENAAAIDTLEKAFLVNGAGWRTHLLLAVAYAKSNQFTKAETHAERSVALAGTRAAYPNYVLAEIQAAQGRESDARLTWQNIIAQFPDDPVAVQAKQRLAAPPRSALSSDSAATAELPLSASPSILIPAAVEHPWAPPDVDSTEHLLAASAPCQIDDVLSRASLRLNSQLANLEKFAATERIQHQQIDRYGNPGPVRDRSFSYIIFVHPLPPASYFLEEIRDGSGDVADFPTSLATRGLLGLGVAVLQPLYRDRLSFACEGLTNIRGQAAWQIHFRENEAADLSIREWRKAGVLYTVPVKGRFWLSASTFDLLRIETDLTAPVAALELSRDHLSVDYGPVTFDKSKTTLWLPWSADMYMELHNRRYHHQHFLTDYMLFNVDTSHKLASAPPATPSSH
ncbi:MAG TPA: tetratricopeptide repeat protein [Dongiaceae bacterium]|nr:tetratricopeptide repeat protein [Dongiaceae bacterium]